MKLRSGASFGELDSLSRLRSALGASGGVDADRSGIVRSERLELVGLKMSSAARIAPSLRPRGSAVPNQPLAGVQDKTALLKWADAGHGTAQQGTSPEHTSSRTSAKLYVGKASTHWTISSNAVADTWASASAWTCCRLIRAFLSPVAQSRQAPWERAIYKQKHCNSDPSTHNRVGWYGTPT
jgi:hypothetical protein